MSKVCLGQKEHFRGSPPNYSRDAAFWFALCSSLLHTLSRNAESNETKRWNSRQNFFNRCFQLRNILTPVLGRFLIILLPVNQLCQRYSRNAFQKVFHYALKKPKWHLFFLISRCSRLYSYSILLWKRNFHCHPLFLDILILNEVWVQTLQKSRKKSCCLRS